MMRGILPLKCFSTCAAVVGEIWLAGLALGAARGNPQVRISSCTNGWLGQRMPTVEPPAVTTSAISSERGSTSVSGPGQKAPANLLALGGQSATHCRAMATLATCTITGFSAG